MAFVAVLVLLAVFSLISIVMSVKEDPSRQIDGQEDPLLWARFGLR
jgi:hypothetical protein